MKLRFVSIITKVLFLFLLNSQLAIASLPLPAGFPTNLTQDDLGEFVGSGAYKNVYKVKGFDDYVVAYYQNASASNQEQILQEEIDLLDEFQAKGIRAIDNYGMVQVDGQPAYVMQYIPDSTSISVFDSFSFSIEDDSLEVRKEVLNRFNQNSLNDMNLLYKAMHKYENFAIRDLQFLLAKDGHLYVNDPMVDRSSDFERYEIEDTFHTIEVLASTVFERLYGSDLPFNTETSRFLRLKDYRAIPLGVGNEKTIHEIKGDGDYVVAIPKTDYDEIKDFAGILQLLDEAKSYGIDTVKHYGLVAVETTEGIRPGIIMENIDNGILVKNVESYFEDQNLLSRLNQHTLDDLNKFKQAVLDNERFAIEDLQFLLKRDGHLVFIDPEVISGNPDNVRRSMLGDIESIKEKVQNTITLRGTSATEIEIPKRVMFVWVGGKPKLYEGGKIKPTIWADLDAHIPIELYYDSENMFAGLLKKMIQIKSTTPPNDPRHFWAKQMQSEMQFVDYVKQYGLSDTTRLKFMKEVLRVDSEALEQEAHSIRKYWREDFAVENPKVTLLDIQELFALQDRRIVQLKKIYERELTYRGGNLEAASEVVRMLALDQRGGLYVNHDVSLQSSKVSAGEPLRRMFDFINQDPEKVFFLRFKKTGENNVIASLPHSKLTRLSINNMIDRHNKLMDNPLGLLAYERQINSVDDTLGLTGPETYESIKKDDARGLRDFLRDKDTSISQRKDGLVCLAQKERQKIIFAYGLPLEEKKFLTQTLRAELEQNGINRLGYLKVIDANSETQQIVFSNEEKLPIANQRAQGVDIYAFGRGSLFEEERRKFIREHLRDYSDVVVIKKSLDQFSTEVHNILYQEGHAARRSGLLGKERGEYLREIEEDLSSEKVTYKELTTYQKFLTDKYITQVPQNAKEVFAKKNTLNAFELEKDIKKQYKADKELLLLVKEWRKKSVEFLESQGLEPKNWIPLTENTLMLENGNYQIEYLNKSGIEEEIRKFEVSDDVHLKLKLKIDEITELGRSLEGLKSLEEGATSNGVGQAGMGLVMGIQALIHSTNENWWGNRELKGIYFNAIRAQVVVNLAQAALTVPMTTIEILSIYKELIGSAIPKTFSKVFAVEGALNVGFSIANLVLDSIQLSNSTTAQQRAYSGVMVGFDSVGLGLGLASLGLGLVGATSASVVTGGLAGPIMAVGFGVAVLAQGYQARLDEAEQIANFFTDRRDEYFSANIVDLNDSNSSNTYQFVKASLPVKSINFRSGEINLQPFYVYDSNNYDQGPLGVHECAYYNRYDTSHRTAQQKQDDAISAIDVWRKYPQGMENKYTDPAPVNKIRLTKKSFNPDLSKTFVLPSIAPYYVAYRYGLVSFSSVDHDLRYIRPFNEFGAAYNPGDSVDQAWNQLEFVKSLKSHDVYISLNDANRTLVQPKAYPLSQGILNYKIFGPSSKANNRRRVDVISNASQGGKNNHFFIYKGRNQDFVISGMKGLPEYKGVEYFDLTTNIDTLYEGVISNLWHFHFKVGQDHIYISTIPNTSNGENVNIYFISDGTPYRVIDSSFQSIGNEINIESFHGDILKARPFLKQHTLLSSIVHVGKFVKLKDEDGEYRVPTWFYHKNDIFVYPQISRDDKDHDIKLLKIIQDKNSTRAYFVDYTSKKIFSNVVDKNYTQFAEYSEATKRAYFQNNNSGTIVDAFLSYSGSLLAYTQNGYLYSLVKDQNSSQTYSVLGINYNAYSGSGKKLSDLNSSLSTIVESFKDDNIVVLTPSFIEVRREPGANKASRSYWYDWRKNKFAYKNGAYRQHKNSNILVDMLDHYGLVYDGVLKKIYATPIISYEDFMSQNDSAVSEKEIFTNERDCLDNFKYQGNGVFYGLTCSHKEVFRAENGIGQYRRYQVDVNYMFSDDMSATSNTIALYPQFMIPDHQNVLEYIKRLIDIGEIDLDTHTEYLPWFTKRGKEEFKFYVVPDKNGSFQYGARFYVGLQPNGILGKYADHRYKYIGYDKSDYKGYVFKEDTQELLEIHDLYDIESRQFLQSARAYQASVIFELIDKNSTHDSNFVVPYMDNKKLVTIFAKNNSKITIREGLKDYSLSTYIDVDLSDVNSSKLSNKIEIDFAFGDEIEFRDSYLGKELVVKEANNSKGSIFLSGFQLSSETHESSSNDLVHITLKLKDSIREIEGYIQRDKKSLHAKYSKLYDDSLKLKIKKEAGYTLVSNEIDMTASDLLNDLQLKDSNGNILYTSSTIKTIGKDYLIELKYRDKTKPNVYIYLEHNATTAYHINILGDHENIIKHVAKLSYKINAQESYNSIDLVLQGRPNKNYPVCFYTDTNYQGDKKCVKYNTRTPYLFSPFDNNISSVKFDEDANQTYLRIYTGEDFTANTIRYSTSQPILNSLFSANISSFVVSDDNLTKLPFGVKELSAPNVNYPVCLYSDGNAAKSCYAHGKHFLDDVNASLAKVSVYGDWKFEIHKGVMPQSHLTSSYIVVKRPDLLILSRKYFADSSLQYHLFENTLLNGVDTNIQLPGNIDKIKLTYNSQSIEAVPVKLGDDYFIKINNFNNSHKMLELYFKKELRDYSINFYGSEDVLENIDALTIEYIKNNTHYRIGTVFNQDLLNSGLYLDVPHIQTLAFGSGCIGDVEGYAQREVCNPLNKNQLLSYTPSHNLKNPFTNKCLTVPANSNASKVAYDQCKYDNQAQIFSYDSATKQFLHTASHKCLDVHGENGKDIVLRSCHSGINQKFTIQYVSQKIDEYNLTSDTPFVSKDYSTQVHRGTVYFITPKQQKAQGVTSKIWYLAGSSEIKALVLDDKQTYHTVTLSAQRLTRDCRSVAMNSAVSCQTGSFSNLRVAFYRSANLQLPLGRYKGSFYILAKGWHESSYTQAIKVNINLDLTNIAYKKPTQQSSTYSHSFHPVSSKAVDGDIDGNFNARTTTHTNKDHNAWWQVDLQGNYNINQIKIYNRSDCCSERLNSAKVFISKTPFGNDNLQEAQNRALWTGDITNAQLINNLNVNSVTGRYVRVQLTGTNFLSLAEVKVLGKKGVDVLRSTGVPSEFNTVTVAKTNPGQTINNLKKLSAVWASNISITSKPLTKIDIPEGFSSGDSIWFNFYEYNHRYNQRVIRGVKICVTEDDNTFRFQQTDAKYKLLTQESYRDLLGQSGGIELDPYLVNLENNSTGSAIMGSVTRGHVVKDISLEFD